MPDIERLRSPDAATCRSVAAIHAREIRGGALPLFGERLLARLYRALAGAPRSGVWVARDGGRVVGFLAGCADTRDTCRRVLLQAGLPLGARAAIRLAVTPALWRRFPSLLRYARGEERGPRAELLAIAVAADCQRRGAGRALVGAFEAALRDWGVSRYQVSTNRDEAASNRFYRSLGFDPAAVVPHHDLTLQQYTRDLRGAAAPAAIPWARPRLWGAEAEYVAAALESSWVSGGPFLEQLEERIARFCGVPHAVAAANGTASLHLACLAMGIGPGAEVVVPGFAFMAAANVAIHVGARPVFADVDPESWCVTAAAIERCLSPRTRLIVPVHTYGNVCDMDAILDRARARGVAVLEDAAEAFASRYRGRPAGAIAPAGSFSFQATKTITTGEGGMVVTTDGALAERMRLFRSHGMRSGTYRHEVAGHNFRLTNLQAALGCAQMDNLERILDERRRVHRHYRERLEKAPGVTLQRMAPEVEPALWALAVLLDEAAYPQGRDAVAARLREEGIETRPGFEAASRMPLYGAPPLPASERLGRQVLSLPTFPGLPEEAIDRVCGLLEACRR